MAGQQGGKGNPASKRMMNKQRELRRQRSWARGQKRKEANRKANEARMQANLAELAALGGEQRSYESVRPTRVRLSSGWLTTGHRTTVKRESPGTALARTRRERRAA